MERRYQVLVGTDGSQTSTAAVIWAAREARIRCCELGIVTVVDPGHYGPSNWLLRDELHDSGLPITEGAAAIARSAEPRVQTHRAVLVGSPTRLLSALSRHADLLVVGLRGHHVLPPPPLASVPERLMASATCPLVAVGSPPSTASGPLSCVVAAVDEVDRQAATLEFALAAARRHGTSLHVLHAISPRITAGLGQDEVRRLDQALSPWRTRYLDVPIRLEAHRGSLPEAIAGACAPRELLVLGHHRNIRLAPHVIRAHLRAAVEVARCPIAVVPGMPATTEAVNQPLGAAIGQLAVNPIEATQDVR